MNRSSIPDDQRTVKVWDVPVRLFHWLLVALVAVGALTGFIAPEWWMGVHLWAGYGIIALLAFRLVWGIFGSEYSRIASFSHSSRAIVEHLRGLAMLRPSHHLGHNPAGAVMVVALFVVLTAIVVTGLMELGGEEAQGPLAGLVGFRLGDAIKEVHEGLVTLLLAMVAAHVLGVVVESWLERENLARSMITGIKRVPEGVPRPTPRRARPFVAAFTLGVMVLTGGGLLASADRMAPPRFVALPMNADYQSECGDCHMAYHPSLLPGSSWRGLMATLDDHFGEDASLDPEMQTLITDYLVAHAAETWDSEAARRFSTVSAAAPWRITASPYWLRKHRELNNDLFADKAIRGKANCAACHKDTASGRFDDQQISVPKS